MGDFKATSKRGHASDFGQECKRRYSQNGHYWKRKSKLKLGIFRHESVIYPTGEFIKLPQYSLVRKG